MAAPQVENKGEMGTLETRFPNNSLQLKKEKTETFYINVLMIHFI